MGLKFEATMPVNKEFELKQLNKQALYDLDFSSPQLLMISSFHLFGPRRCMWSTHATAEAIHALRALCLVGSGLHVWWAPCLVGSVFGGPHAWWAPSLVGSGLHAWWAPCLVGSVPAGLQVWWAPCLVGSEPGGLQIWWALCLVGSVSGGLRVWWAPCLVELTVSGLVRQMMRWEHRVSMCSHVL